jgi:hypothetical protein
MNLPFQHPRGKELLKRVADIFRSDSTYILRDSNIVLVCGGPVDKPNIVFVGGVPVEKPSMRKRFLEYGSRQLNHLRLFLAENAEADYVSNVEAELLDVGKFEEIIAEICDCLIIFPESAGSFAELGYFSRSEELRKKILVVNDAELQGQDSFIRRGPIHSIDAVSQFKTEIQVEYNEKANFDLVKERLEHRIVGKRRKRFEFTKFSDLTPRVTFFAIFEIIRLFEVMSLDAVEYAFRSIFTNVNISLLKQLLSILVAADLVRRAGRDQEFFCINRNARPFMEFENFDEIAFRLSLDDLYVEEFPEIASVVQGLS